MHDPQPLLIHGQPVKTRDLRSIRSPWTHEPVGECYWAGEEEIKTALDSGTEGANTMRNLRSYQRAAILHKAATLIGERREEFARVIAEEGGKPIREARAEAIRAESTFRLAAEAVRNWNGEVIPLDVTPAAGDRVALVRRYPVGLVVAIAPFNFPLNLVAHKVAPALAAGCAVIVKPASTTPLTALMLGQLLLDAGLPPGCCNVIPTDSKLAGPLLDDPRVKFVTFTGSGAVGWGLKQRANQKKVCLELGGNAAAIVEPSCDLDHAIRRMVVGGYAHTGQICISVQHILLHQDVYRPFMERFVPMVRDLVMGDPLDETTEIAAMIDEKEAIRIEEWIGEAVGKGGVLLTGGVRAGNRVTPAVLEDVPEECRISREEAFGPVTVVRRYSRFEEALEWVNAQQYGLQAGVFTSDLKQAMLAFNLLEVGGVVIDDVPTLRVDNYPYGGVKNSGFGREGVKYAMEEMSELRTLVLPSPK